MRRKHVEGLMSMTKVKLSLFPKGRPSLISPKGKVMIQGSGGIYGWQQMVVEEGIKAVGPHVQISLLAVKGALKVSRVQRGEFHFEFLRLPHRYNA